MTRFVVDVARNTESDILAELQAQPNKARYIKRLIREDIARRNGGQN